MNKIENQNINVDIHANVDSDVNNHDFFFLLLIYLIIDIWANDKKNVFKFSGNIRVYLLKIVLGSIIPKILLILFIFA